MRYMFCLMKFLYAKTMKIKILKIINIFSSNTLEDSDIFLYPPLIHKEKITLNSVKKKFHSIVLSLPLMPILKYIPIEFRNMIRYYNFSDSMLINISTTTFQYTYKITRR